MASNLFSSLARYATRQEENFLTESLVYLLNLILERENEIGLSILAKLCGEMFAAWLENVTTISINTQFTVDEGRPDIVIHIDLDKIVFIEVKHDSSLGQDQLESYYAHLEKSDYREKQIVLLTRSRHSIQETTLEQERFHHVCWYEISGWLSDAAFQDEVTQYLVQKFLDFLQEKEMSMEKVTWEYMQGVSAMINLVNMIGTAISEVAPEGNTRKSVGASWAGFYLDGEYFVGLRYANPLLIVFENNIGTNPSFKRDLYLENVHFFSLTAGEQLECLIDFISSSYNEFGSGESNRQLT